MRKPREADEAGRGKVMEYIKDKRPTDDTQDEGKGVGRWKIGRWTR